MHISVLELFTIGIGPSSSHTVGPMKAALDFSSDLPAETHSIRCDLYGSLAATGKGHGTDKAIIGGFLGEHPETIDLAGFENKLSNVHEQHRLTFKNGLSVSFDPHEHLTYHRLQPLPLHPNGMHFIALDAQEKAIKEVVYYSLGGGFISTEEEIKHPPKPLTAPCPHPFDTADDLLELCRDMDISIPELMMSNEKAIRPEKVTHKALDRIWETMQLCVRNGIEHTGVLPGGLKVKRRAHALHNKLINKGEALLSDPLAILDWVNLYALAVNEENAAGGRVVTAPTNGAAGIIPAVLHYATRFTQSPHKDAVRRFLLTAAAIASLYKKNASISGADVGCQGEVGVACSMAAGALVDYLGGDALQVENAAEIAMEHNLGLTCDPIGGLVQIPCIERNAMASVKAINAARMAMSRDCSPFVSLDRVIKTMWDTGKDMQEKYKETSRGGLAVNVIEC